MKKMPFLARLVAPSFLAIFMGAAGQVPVPTATRPGAQMGSGFAGVQPSATISPSGVSPLTFPLSGHAGVLPNDVSTGGWPGGPPAEAQSQPETQVQGSDYLWCSANADTPPAEIVALAASLKNNYQLIFQYVNNNIDTELTGESTKGPLGTYLDRSGNSFDQSSLLVSMLRAAGYTAQFVVGQATVLANQIGVPNQGNSAYLPSQLILDAGGTSGQVPYAWVQVKVNGQWISLDPAFKTYTTFTGFSNYGSGMVQTPFSNSTDNAVAIAGLLTSAAQVPYDANTSNIDYAPFRIYIGGAAIQNQFQLQTTGRTGGTVYQYLPTSVRTGISFASSNVSASYICTDQVYGHNLSMHGATLFVDGLQVTTGYSDPVNIVLWHPNGTGWSQSVAETMTNVNASVALGAGRISRFRASHDSSVFNQMGGTQLVPNSDQALTATASGQLSQTSATNQMLDQIAGTYTVTHHILQIVRTNNTLDTPMTSTSVDTVNAAPNSGLTVSPKAVTYALAAIQSAQEAVALGQSGASQPVSAAGLLGNLTSYQSVQFVAAHNPAPTVSGGYSTAQQSLLGSYLASGYDVVAPTTAPGASSPLGFMAMNASGGAIFLLNTSTGTYKGAADLNPVTPLGGIGMGGAASEAGPSGNGLNINPSSGEVTFAAPLISVGSAASPFKLEFDLLYSSRPDVFPKALSPDGWGFAHNMEIRETQTSDGFPLTGTELGGPSFTGFAAAYSILVASNAIVSYYQSGGTAPTAAAYQVAASAAWLMSKSTNNVVTISRGLSNEVFMVMPDGGFHALTPTADHLSYSNGVWTWTGAHGDTLVFNSSDGQVASAKTAAGVQTNFTYSMQGSSPSYNLLSKVSVGPHSLNFYYTSYAQGLCPKLNIIKDETNREVQLTYNSGTLQYAYKPDNIGGSRASLQFGMTPETEGASSTGYPLTQVVDGKGYFTSPSYDVRQMPVSLTNANQHATSYFIAGSRTEVDDALGNASYSNTYPVIFYGDWIMTDSFDPLLNKTTTLTSHANQLIWKRLPNGQANPDYTYAYTYDAYNNVTSTTVGPSGTPQQLTTSTTWDPTWNKPATMTDADGNVTTNYYDSSGNLSKVVQPSVPCSGPLCANSTIQPTTKFTYEPNNGLVATMTAPDGEVTSYNYDSSGGTWNLLSVVVDSGSAPHLNLTTTLTYDDNTSYKVGNVTSVTTPDGNKTTATYDLARRLSTKTNPPLAWFNNAALTTTYTYDANGRLTTGSFNTGTSQGGNTVYQVSTQTYDPVGNLIQSTLPTTGTTARTTYYTPDNDERLSVTKDPSGQKTTQTYDADSRPFQTLDGSNNVVKSVYYTGDSLTDHVVDGNGNSTQYTYDNYDRLTTTTYSNGTSEQVTLDSDGRVTQRIDRTNNTFAYTLDALGRETSETDTPGTQGQSGYSKSFAYDPASRTVILNGTGGNFTFGYDTAGRQAQTAFAGLSNIGDQPYTVNFTYDSDGNTKTITYPDNYIYTYSYDALDEMLSVAETTPSPNVTTSTLVNYSWNTLGALTGAAFGNGTSTAYANFDQYNHFQQINDTFANGSLTVNYTLDSDERRTQDSFSDSTYVWHPPASASVTYAPNNLNQYSSITTSAGNQALAYNTNGALHSDPTAPLGSATYSWDMFNRLVAASNSQHTASYTYDTMGRRVNKSVDGTGQNFAYDGQHIIMEYGAAAFPTGTILHWVYGVGNAPFVQEQFSNGAIASHFYLFPDAQDTTLTITGDIGHSNTTFPTSPWGEVNSTTSGTPFRFDGMWLDAETMLYYDHARYYSPAQGRFISPDPIGSAGGMDIYAFAGNDPVNSFDVSGLANPTKTCNASTQSGCTNTAGGQSGDGFGGEDPGGGGFYNAGNGGGGFGPSYYVSSTAEGYDPLTGDTFTGATYRAVDGGQSYYTDTTTYGSYSPPFGDFPAIYPGETVTWGNLPTEINGFYPTVSSSGGQPFFPTLDPDGMNSALRFWASLPFLVAGIEEDAAAFIAARYAPRVVPTIIHSAESILSNPRYEQLAAQTTEEIVDSLAPTAEYPLTVAPDGRVFDGNTRLSILQDRGVDIGSLPQVSYNPGKGLR